MANLHVNLAFSADTGKAKVQIQELQTLLSKIAYTGSTTNVTGTMQDDLKKASMAAKDLQFHLNNAFNTSTGKFDLSLLDKSLKTSGTNISKLSTQLLGAGETGQQAFMKLAQSISLADQPMLRVSKRMQEFAVTMKNTVKWQLSSSMLHGFMGAIQSAYGYAQDLNKSLTDIRIVTGYSADQMAVFAEQANKAAKSLSTTTNDYTNASLIYFQQGLTDAEVAERTAVTVKMANAAGESAQIVSDQLTAVWNNFYDGSKSLEYYADVMTALGAATASSTDEISEGLSKFAAVAETVGLSYEYATAALTTITSNTRESADVVGNALKTLFARIQGLKLGETLEDGVDLNKYSEALHKAGISIFESNGELKAMDNILIELAGRWDTMSNTQQVALAQTVAGVRQYTQLIALMENWDNGDADSMMANLRTIEGAEGALDEQAEIYAQSWEAASKRVQAAAEGIYQSLLDDDFFISLNNGFANLLGGLDAFIDGAGGVKTVLTGIAGIALSTFAHQIPQALDTLKYNISVITKGSQKAYADMQEDINKATKDAFDAFQQNTTTSQFGIKEDSATGYAIKQANELTAARSKLAIVSDKMSAAERQAAEVQLGLIQAQQNEVIALKEKNEQMQEAIRLNLESIKSGIIDSDFNIERGQSVAGKLEKHYGNDYPIGLGPEDFAEMQTSAMELGSIISAQITSQLETAGVATEGLKNDFNGTINVIEDASGAMTLFGQQFDKVKTGLQTLQGRDISDSEFSQIRKQAQEFIDILPSGVANIDAVKKAINNLGSAKNVTELITRWEALEQVLKGIPLTAKNVGKALEGSANADSVKILSSNMGLLGQNTEKAAQEVSILENLYKEFQPTHVIRMSEAFGALGGLIGNVSTSFMSLKSAIQAITNPDLSGWEKFSAVLSSAGMLIPNILSGMSSWATLNAYNTQLLEKENLALTKQAMLNALNANSFNYKKGYVTISQKIVSSLSDETKKTLALTLAETALKNSKQALTAEEKQQVISKVALILADGKQVTAAHITVAANLVEDASTKVLTTSIWGLVKAKMALSTVATGIIIAITAIAAAIAAAVAAYNYFNVSQEEANEAIAEANNAYDEEKQKLEELKNELQSVNDQIEELNSQDQLDIVSQAELDKLEARRASLEAQVALQEKLAADAQREQADTIVNNWDKSSLLSNKQEITKATGEYGLGLIETVDEYGIPTTVAGYTRQQEDIDQYINRMKQTDHYNSETGRFDDVTEAFIANWRAEIEAANAEYAANNQQQYLQNEANYRAVAEYAANNVNYQWNNKEQMQNDLAKQRKDMYGENYDDLFIKPLLNAAEQISIKQDKDGNYTVSGISSKEMDLYGINQGELDTWLNNQINKNPEAFAELEKIQDLDFSKLSPDQLFLLLNNLEQLEHFDGSSMEELITYLTKISNIESPKSDLDTWKANYTASKDIVSGLKVGDTIDQSEYDQLDVAAQQFFTNTGDGIYTLTQNAELLRDVVNDIAAQALKDEIAEINNLGGMSQKTANQHALNIEAGNAAGMAFLNSGSDEAYIEDVNAKYGTSFTEFAEAVAYVNERLGELQSNLATTADQLGELDTLMASGQISSGDYINQLQVLATQYENCADELANYQRALEEGNEEAANAADAALHGAIRAGELAKQYNLSAETIERYAEELKDSGKYADASSKALVEMAKDQLRFDRAVENSRKNMKQWKQDLQIAAKTGHLASESAEQMAEAYGDLLDIDGDLLPSSFLKDTENLKLMEKALKGNEEAYQSLLDKSRQAIAMKIGLDDTAFQNGFNDLLSKYYQAQSLDDIQVGASLDNAGFLQGLTDMVNAANMTAAEATSYLASMGVDAEVVEEPTVSEDTQTYVSATPNISWHSSAGTNPVTGGPALYTFPEVSYSTSTETIPTSKTTTGVALRVTSANKSSGGAVKHGGSSAAASPSKGGGGGGSKKEPKYAEKKNTSDKTRYHTLQNQLEDLTAEYDALADASDRAFGQAKLDAIDAEIKKTDELIDKQEEYLQAIQSDLPVDKSVMTAYYNDTIGGPAMQFDENGNISNYDQIQDAMFNKYNAMTAYDEESLEWQTFEKKYEQLEKYIEQYEETYDLLREEEANYQDLLKQRIDLELEKVEYKVEIDLEVPENQKEVIEYQLGRIEDDAKKTGETLALLTEQAEMTYDQILINKQGLNDALELSLSAAEITEVMAGNMDVLNDKTFTEDQISAIQDYKDNLLELNEEFDDIRESIEETVLEAFDMWHEKLEEGIEKFDYFGTILESYQSIIDTVGKDTLGISDSLINTLSQASVDNAINGVEATRDAYKALQQAQIDAERELEKAKARGDEQSISFWESTLNEIQQNAEDAHEEMLSSWEEALSKIVEQFEASIQTAVDAFNEAVYQLGGIEALSEEFDRQKEMADMYLDDYQKIYELSKLNRDVNNSIDDTDSLAGKQKLKKLLGEINKLQADGVKMSEYDLEYLQAEYDLRLAEIALEEAQRAKDVVRLSRDNEGNWSYVYTQNTEAVDEAQQKYEDALYAMQDLSSNYIDEISAQLIETSQEMQEALAAIRIEDYASIEEYYEEVERVQEQYQEQLALQEEELNKAVANNKELYDTDWTNYHNAVGYKISDTEEFATKFSDTLLGTLMNSESDTSNFTSILADATSTLMNELYGAAEQYYTNMAAAMEAAGTATGTFADDLATNVDQIKQDSEEAATAVEDMATHMQEQMDNIINKVGEWQRTYGEAMNEIINTNLAVIDSFNEMLATLSMDDSTVTVKYDIQNHNSDVLDAERFATGGYTGSWGNTGKLGILDEKELILNKDDTENFIEALKISRSMLNTIELNARQASLGLGTLIPTTVKDDIKETLEQVVQITAEFPNATDHNEIEEAFNMLINRASQFANRK